MATYITLLSYTEQGIKNAKGIPERVLAAGRRWRTWEAGSMVTVSL